MENSLFLVSTAAKVATIFFVSFFLLSLFVWLKVWFEISKFKKLEKIKNNLLLFKSPFYLNKLVELKNLALQNKTYVPVFLAFFHNYKKLFIEEIQPLLDQFLQEVKKQDKLHNFLVESEKKYSIFKELELVEKQILTFANNLRTFSIWENFCLDKVNEFNLLLEKGLEELERIKMIVAFDFSATEALFDDLRSKIMKFEKFIYWNEYDKTFAAFLVLENKIIEFLQNFATWIKILHVNYILLPKKNKQLVTKFAKMGFEDDKVLNVFVEQYHKKSVQIENLLGDWEVNRALQLALSLLNSFDENLNQLDNIDAFKRVCVSSYQVLIKYFDNIKKDIFDLLSYSESANKNYLLKRFQDSGFKDFMSLINENQKDIDDLYIVAQNIEKIYFFKPILKRIQNVLFLLLELLNIYFQMNLFFTRESEMIGKTILTLMSLNNLINKKEFFFLKQLHQNELNKCVNFFMDFEKNKLNIDIKQGNYGDKLLMLQAKVLNLKITIQNTMLLKNIAEALFVRANQRRFENEIYQNKILNAEILFLKQQFKNVIEILLEILDPTVPL